MGRARIWQTSAGLVIFIWLGLGERSQAAVIIDNFSGLLSVSVAPATPNPSSANMGLATANAIGAARNLTTTRLTGTNGMNTNADIGGTGLFSFGTGPGDTGSASLIYDGGTDNTLNPAGLGAFDITQAGANDRIVVLYRSDLAGATVNLDIYSSAGNSSRTSFATTATGFGGAPYATVNLSFADFSTLAGAGANFASVGAIQLTIDGSATPALDVQIDSVTAVPEPGGLSLLGGLVLLIGRRASRQK